MAISSGQTSGWRAQYFSTNPLSCNWYDIADPYAFLGMPVIDFGGQTVLLADWHAIKAVFKGFGIVTNETDGANVVFPAASAEKMLYQGDMDILAIAAHFKVLFEKSRRAWNEREVPMPENKFHFNVSSCGNYICQFRLRAVDYFVRFTIRKIGTDPSVHASTISEVAICRRKAEDSLTDSHLETPKDGRRMPLVDNKLSFFLSACRGDSSVPQPQATPSLLARLHARMGDFWWYSLMIFMAARAADCLNVFVGLWLVPKYVPPSELGAVMPLTQFAAFLAMPAAVFASTFRNELTGLATRREFGKMKTLMRSVFVATAVFFFVAIVVCHFVLPHFLLRIRMVEGSLGMLVLIASFLGAVAPVYSNALQSLKKFKETSVINLLCAPIRFVTMIVMMPFRAISGYFVGQSSTPAFTIVASIFALRKELKAKAEPYWTKAVIKRFSTIFGLFIVGAIAANFSDLVQTTILRQRLPEIDSAAYYMVTRFSDIAGFVAAALGTTIFPFAAELAAKGKSSNRLVFKATGAALLTNLPLALFFWLFGEPILKFLPNGALYASYYWAIPWIIGITTLSQFAVFYLSAESAGYRFACMVWTAPLYVVNGAALLFVTGYGYFVNYLPVSVCEFLATHNIHSLSAILWWFTGFNVVRTFFILWDMTRKKRSLYVT